MKDEEFRKYLSIDKLALDEAVIQQPALFEEVADAYAEAIAKRDACKEQLDVTDAKLDRVARHKLSEPKEAEIKAFVKTDPRHHQAFDDYLQAKEKADKLTGLKDAFKQRSQALRILADLYASNYFDDASVKTSAAQDKIVYHSNRKKLAAKRSGQS